MTKLRLGVNIDQVSAIRNARGARDAGKLLSHLRAVPAVKSDSGGRA